MRIYPPTLVRSGERIRVSARVELEERHPDRVGENIPETLWYEFPAEAEAMLYLGPEPFIATLLPFAMAIREPIEVEAPISPQFAYHVQRFQQLYQVWNPDLFQEVPLKTLGYSPPESNPATEAVGLMFSGGVDSFG